MTIDYGYVYGSGLHSVKKNPDLLSTSDDGKCDKPEPEEKVDLLVDDVHLQAIIHIK